MSSTGSPSAHVADSDTTQGQVKWFNSSQGYGFITFTDDTGAESDVFVHHSALRTSVDQYKYLVQGEYVKFTLAEAGGAHEKQAGQVWGSGGKLMCEVHFDNKSKRQSYVNSRRGGDKSDDDESDDVARRERRSGGRGGRGRQGQSGRGRQGQGGRGKQEARQMTDEDGNVWTLVPKRGRN